MPLLRIRIKDHDGNEEPGRHLVTYPRGHNCREVSVLLMRILQPKASDETSDLTEHGSRAQDYSAASKMLLNDWQHHRREQHVAAVAEDVRMGRGRERLAAVVPDVAVPPTDPAVASDVDGCRSAIVHTYPRDD